MREQRLAVRVGSPRLTKCSVIDVEIGLHCSQCRGGEESAQDEPPAHSIDHMERGFRRWKKGKRTKVIDRQPTLVTSLSDRVGERFPNLPFVITYLIFSSSQYSPLIMRALALAPALVLELRAETT
jgi:hypothetical protein